MSNLLNKLILLISCLFVNCATITIKDCCLDPQSCIEMDCVKNGYKGGILKKVTGTKCDKKITYEPIK